MSLEHFFISHFCIAHECLQRIHNEKKWFHLFVQIATPICPFSFLRTSFCLWLKVCLLKLFLLEELFILQSSQMKYSLPSAPETMFAFMGEILAFSWWSFIALQLTEKVVIKKLFLIIKSFYVSSWKLFFISLVLWFHNWRPAIICHTQRFQVKLLRGQF